MENIGRVAPTVPILTVILIAAVLVMLYCYDAAVDWYEDIFDHWDGPDAPA